jgi:hypothetical protein
MNKERLEALGFNVSSLEGEIEAKLELISGSLLNPLTRKFLAEAHFTVIDERLVAIAPPELLGLPPLTLEGVERVSEFETRLADLFNEHVMHMQRRSAELIALGLEPKVDPDTLVLSTEVPAGNLTVVLTSDKRGQFHISEVRKGPLHIDREVGQPLELAEFRELAALSGYLAALLGETIRPVAAPARSSLRFAEVVARFGRAVELPPASGLELLVEMEVDGVRYRFAAARVAGTSFRGLLAGPKGKMWAERFELDEFAGPARLLASALGVDEAMVRFPAEV